MKLTKKYVDSLYAKAQKAEKRLQKICKHLRIKQHYDRKETWPVSSTPSRECLDCGITERGWSYEVLAGVGERYHVPKKRHVINPVPGYANEVHNEKA